MRTAFLIALLVLTTGAWSFDGPSAAKAYNEFRAACRLGEIDGRDVEPEKFCADMNALGKELTQNGWCWNPSEVEWFFCGQSKNDAIMVERMAAE